MDRRVPWALVVTLLLAGPQVRAEGDQHEYLLGEGTFAVGLVVTGADNVSQASFVVTPVQGFHHLRFDLRFGPEGLALETPAADAKLRYEMLLEVRDAATGAERATFEYHGGGLATFTAADESSLLVVLRLTSGADVDWRLRINALPDPRPVEA